MRGSDSVELCRRGRKSSEMMRTLMTFVSRTRVQMERKSEGVFLEEGDAGVVDEDWEAC